MASFLVRPRRKRFRVGFAVVEMEMDILFWESMLHVGELPEFVSLMARDRSRWPHCLLWHGWLPGLGVPGERNA